MAAAVFSVQPASGSVQPVYHPIKFTVTHTSTLAIESVRCEITVTVNGTAHYYKIRIPYSTKVGNVYTFNYDLSAFCKQHLPPFTNQVSSAFRFSVVNYSDIDNPDFWAILVHSVYPEYRNSAGLLVDESGANATSYTIRVIPAAYRRTDTKNLTAYTNNTGGYNKFLTKRPSGSVWCTNTEASLSFYSSLYKTVSGTTIIFYWEAKAWTGSTPSPIELSTTVTKNGDGQITIPLNTILANLPSNITKIQVSLIRAVGSTYTRFSELYDILIDRNCCSGVQFSWFNELGGVDNYAFCGEAETEFSVKNEFGQQYDDGVTTRLKSNYKTSSEIGEVIQVRDLLPATDVDWIKYILASHEVYVKIGSAWYNCVILDGATITESNMLGMFDFSFSARLSDVVSNHN